MYSRIRASGRSQGRLCQVVTMAGVLTPKPAIARPPLRSWSDQNDIAAR